MISDVLVVAVLCVSVGVMRVWAKGVAEDVAGIRESIKFSGIAQTGTAGALVDVRKEIAALKDAVDRLEKAVSGRTDDAEIVPGQNVTAASRVAALRSQLWNLESMAAMPEVEK